MTDFFEVVKTRRSVRSYTAEPVSEQDLRELIDLAVLAPTGMNFQPWAFTVVTDPKVMRRLNSIVLEYLRSPAIQQILPSDSLRRAVNDPAYDIFYAAPALVTVAGNVKAPTASTDCQLAAENFFLAARAKGLGTCYMGFLLSVRENPAVKDLLRIPGGYELMAAFVVGRPGALPEEAPKRNPPRIEWVR